MNSDSYLYLHELDDDTIKFLVTADRQKVLAYIDSLIDMYFTRNNTTLLDKELLVNSYLASFALEHIYRTSDLLKECYTPVYTKYGMLREVTLDVYGIGLEKTTVH